MLSLPALSLNVLRSQRWLAGAAQLVMPLGLLLALAASPALAQPTLTGLSPARNQRAAPAGSNVALTFNQAISAGTAGNIRVFSQQRGGQLVRAGQGVVSGGGTSTVTFNPTTDFRPGETVTVTVPAAVQSTGGVAATKHVYQFTAAVAGGAGTFSDGPDTGVGTLSRGMTVGDVDGDGDLDLLTANAGAPNDPDSTVSVRLNDGSGTFSGGSTVQVGTSPWSVVVGDVDGDGDLDLLTANYEDHSVSVRLNDGNGAFGGGSTVPVDLGPVYVVVGDVDGDGDLDLLTATRSSTVSVRLNDGTGTFTGGSNVAVGFEPNSVALGDIDGDGDLDFVTANLQANTASVRFNNGSGTFSGGANLSVGSVPRSVALGDLDGDGDLDLLVACGSTVSMRFNDGAGAFSGGAEVPVGSSNSVAVGDVDGDGDLDFVTGNRSVISVSVRLNDGAGNFSDGSSAGENSLTYSVVLGDVDGDGDLDLLVSDAYENTVNVLRNQVSAPTLTGLNPTSAVAGTSITLTGTTLTGATGISFNGTAAVTFAVANATTATATVPAGATSGPVTITTPAGTSNGVAFTVLTAPVVTAVSPARNLRSAPRAASVAVTFDQPMSNAAASAGSVKVFSHQRGGRLGGTQGGAASVSGNTITFNPTTDFRPGETVFVTTTPAAQSSAGANLARGHVHQFTTATGGTGRGNFVPEPDLTGGNLTSSAAVGDVDGDGDLDLLTTNNFAGTVSVRRNDGSGTFSGGTEVPAATLTYGVAVGDVDGDGDLDFVASGESSSSNVSVHLNDGTGTFGGGSTTTVGGRPRCVVLGDVDGDGDLDLLTAGYDGNLVSVRRNDGSGHFSGGNDYGVGTRPRSVAVADVDGDGDLDFVATTYDPDFDINRVSVWRNDGTGTFSNIADYNVGRDPRNVAIGDIDGDGDLDLVTANRGSNSVGVFLNNGDGTFSAPAPVGLSVGPGGVALADVDSDGDLDLLTSNYRSYSVSVRFNDGSGTFSGGGDLALNGDGNNLAVGDVDGDGDLDLLTANYSAGTVSILLNQPPAPTLTSLNPTSAVVGTSITLTGTTLTGATGISFNGTAAVTFAVANATTATATVPAGATSGPVTITTPGGTSNGVAFTVVTNQAPTAVGLSPQSVAENTPGGTAIGNFSTTDPDAGDTFTYTLVSGAGSTDNGAFSINGSGQLVITAAPDYEAQATYAIRVRATDQDGLWFEQTFSIAVTDVAEDLTVSTTQTIPAGTWQNVTITGTGAATLGGTLTVTGALVVQAGGALADNCHVIGGAGSFTLAAGATLSICSAQGISASGATGAVQVAGARSFAGAADYLYTSPGAQITGNGLPATVRSLGRQGAGTLTLSQATAVTDVLRLEGGTLATNSQPLTLLSTATRTAYVVHAGGLTSGAVTVQRYVPAPTAVSYHHLSSPVQAAPVSDLATIGFAPKVNPAYNNLPYVAPPAATYPNVFGFDETRGSTTPAYQGFGVGYFSPATLGTVLVPGRGYSVAIGGGKTPDFVGALTTGNVNVPLSVTGALTAANKAGWQLLGNPYAQPIDWDLLATPANLDASVFVWYSTGGSNGAYRVRNASGVGNLTDGLIGVGQGFWVRASAPTTFPFTNALRVANDAVPLGRAALTSTAPRLTLTLAQAGAAAAQTDEVTIYEQAGATTGFDGAFDAARPGRNVGVPTLSALINGEEAMISAVPEASLTAGTTVELALDLPAAGVYTLGVGTLTNLSEVVLLDRLTGTRYDLTTQPTVTFSAARAGALPGRFALVFGQRVLGTASEVAPRLTLWPNPTTSGVVRLTLPTGTPAASAVRLLDAAGRTVRHATLTADGALDVRGLAPGIYAVRVGTATARLVIE